MHPLDRPTAAESRAYARLDSYPTDNSIFSGIPPLDVMVDRVLDHWRDSDAETRAVGAQWYDVAAETITHLGAEHGVERDLALGVFAVTSAGLSPELNVAATLGVLTGQTVGLPAYGDMVDWALTVAEGETDRLLLDADGRLTRSRKVRTFWLNLRGAINRVTVDRWMLRAVGIDRESLSDAGPYLMVERAFKTASERVGIAPRTMQATVWSLVRGGDGLDAFVEPTLALLEPAPTPV